MLCYGHMRIEKRACIYLYITYTERRNFRHNHIKHEVAVSQVVVKGHRHSVAKSCELYRFFYRAYKLIHALSLLSIPSAELILSEAGKIAESAVKRDFEELDGSTAGGRLYLESGIRGIRGEAMDGFPSVKNIALPAYKSAISDRKNKNDAGALTLLHLIASVYDTSLYNRGGKEGVAYAQMRARELLSMGEPTLDEIRKLDVDFTEKNLSPGGCADLLAITYFITELETGL